MCASEAHGIAGNRYFPGTLTFDDAAVADAAFLPIYPRVSHPTKKKTDRANVL
jgi:hypothetical protein